jgi:hypothetical protein
METNATDREKQFLVRFSLIEFDRGSRHGMKMKGNRALTIHPGMQGETPGEVPPEPGLPPLLRFMVALWSVPSSLVLVLVIDL